MDEISHRLDHAHEEKMAAMAPGEHPPHPSESINYKDAPPDIRARWKRRPG
jgi:hypothetical protein